MYLAGVSVRRVEDITEALWGTVSAQVPRYAECKTVLFWEQRFALKSSLTEDIIGQTRPSA